MNTPNKLTIARIVMIPFFVAFLMYDIAGSAGKWIALAVFIIASLTDTLDGYLARRDNLVTNFGKCNCWTIRIQKIPETRIRSWFPSFE